MIIIVKFYWAGVIYKSKVHYFLNDLQIKSALIKRCNIELNFKKRGSKLCLNNYTKTL